MNDRQRDMNESWFEKHVGPRVGKLRRSDDELLMPSGRSRAGIRGRRGFFLEERTGRQSRSGGGGKDRGGPCRVGDGDGERRAEP